MLISLAAVRSEGAAREIERFAGWAEAIRRLRRDWGEGRPAAPATYSEALPEEQRTDALADLVIEHLRCAWRAAPGPLAETLLPGPLPDDVIEEEFLARHQAPYGDRPGLDEYRRRFPDRRDLIDALSRRTIADGRYVLLRRIGRGGLAQVWEACDRRLGRQVAVKRADAGESSALLASETRLLARLDHPAIVDLQDAGEGFAVLRLAGGRTLSERIRDHHRSPAAGTRRRLLEALAIVCDAVASAHAAGILHRDLKPGNVLVDDFGGVVVVDWGMAREVGAPRDALAAGTPECMAPEQADGISDERTDVFGLGSILHEILTGRPPRSWSLRPADWMRRVREVPVERLSGALGDLCSKATAFDPKDRYATASELGAEIRQRLAEDDRPFWRRLLGR